LVTRAVCGGCLNLRLLFELWAASSYAAAVAETLVQPGNDENDVGEIRDKVDRLVVGARHPVMLPWGEVATIEAISIQTMVDKLDQRSSGAAIAYGLLSAGSHPCFAQHEHLHMMGRTGDNWTNSSFTAHAHDLLHDFLSVGSRSVNGINVSVGLIVKCCSPLHKQFLAHG
jgi:hypothetical protein